MKHIPQIIPNVVEREAWLSRALSEAEDYPAYRNRVSHLAETGGTTGKDPDAARVGYTLLNHNRMKRWDKTLRLPAAVVDRLDGDIPPQTWLVLTESWCGDAAPILPVLNAMAEILPQVRLRIASRDEHPELMDLFRTEGALSIPKLIRVADKGNRILGDWGPRPVPARQLVNDYKAEHGKLTAEFRETLQQWYNRDKGQTVAYEIAAELLADK